MIDALLNFRLLVTKIDEAKPLAASLFLLFFSPPSSFLADSIKVRMVAPDAA